MTLTVDPNWRNVSLPMLTPQKFKELMDELPHTCKGETCVFDINITQEIQSHNMILVGTGYEKVNKDTLLITEVNMDTKVYIVKANTQRLLGTSRVLMKLVSHTK
jgi:hypothetical protein